jgi:hypothetical protein
MAEEATPVETPTEEDLTFKAPEEEPEAEVIATEEAAVEGEEQVDEVPEVPDDYRSKAEKRIGKAVKRQREAEERAARLEGRLEEIEKQREEKELPGTPPKPKEEDFDNYDDYILALTDWRTDQKKAEWIEEAEKRILEREEGTSQESFNEKMREASERYDNFDDVVSDPAAPINTLMADIIRSSDMPGDVAYYLCTHRQEATAIYHMRDAGKIGRELGKIEAKILAAQGEKPKPPTPNPAPSVGPVGGSGSAVITKDPDKMTNEEYRKAREEGKI